MTPAARKNALALIAREHVLTRRDLLDLLGRPERLRVCADPDVARLVHAAGSIIAALPPDLGVCLPPPSEKADGTVGSFDSETGVLLVLKELVGSGGIRWVCAVSAAVYRGPEDVRGVPPESVNVLVNRLNVADAGAAWTTSVVAGEPTVVRLCAAARPFDEGSQTWFELVAYLLATSFAASERGDGRGASFVELLERGDEAEGFSPEEIAAAAFEFRDSFPPDIARAVSVDPVEDGVGVTIPFHADGDVHALSALFTSTAPGEANGVAPGLRVIAGFYEQMRTRDAYRWARIFNGDDDTPEPGDSWDQTTPWLLGSWQALEVESDTAAVLYRGVVPAALKAHATALDVISGVVREMWSVANRYRLRREFEETVRGSHVEA